MWWSESRKLGMQRFTKLLLPAELEELIFPMCCAFPSQRTLFDVAL